MLRRRASSRSRRSEWRGRRCHHDARALAAEGGARPDKSEMGATLARILLDHKQDAGRARAAANVALEHDPTNVKAQLVAGEADFMGENRENAVRYSQLAAAHLYCFEDADAVRLLGPARRGASRRERSIRQ